MDGFSLRELEGELKKHTGAGSMSTVATLAEADGVMFACPKCFAANGGGVGTHYVLCWFAGKVPADLDPKPGRWIPSGSTIDDLTLVGPAAASVLLTGGC